MDSNLYLAAITGNVNIINQNVYRVEAQLTPDNWTILHLASISGQTEAVNAILHHLQTDSLLMRVNSCGESALHIASRGGHTQIVKLLIKKARELNTDEELRPKAFQSFLWMVNKEGETALHEAVRYHHTLVAISLIGEDTNYPHSSNIHGETPLYIAASRGFADLVDVILTNCTPPRGPAYSGPYSTNALHGAAICKDEKSSQDCLEKILNSELSRLTEEVDLYGQTPLHYATHSGSANKVRMLLSRNVTTVYVADNDTNTPLHIATSRGNISIMDIIMSQCPDSCHMVDSKGRNILHIAAVKEKKSAVEFILKHCPIVNSLIVQKDVDGNTPLHLLATTNTGFVEKLIKHSMADKEALNREKFTPFDMVNYTNYVDDREWPKLRILKGLRYNRTSLGYPNVKKMNLYMTKSTGPTTTSMEEDDDMIEEYLPVDPRKIVDNHIIVATLIATVAFAAGFTIPGGYIQSGSTNEGMVILTREKAFKLFMMFDVLALIFSVIAIVIYAAATDYLTKRKIVGMNRAGGGFIIVGLGAMLLAFVMGTYVVLSPSPGLATATLVVGCMGIPSYVSVLLKYLRDYITYDM